MQTPSLLIRFALFAVFLSAACGGGNPDHHALPTFWNAEKDILSSGTAYAGVERFDQQLKRVMVQWNIPGAVFALAYRGKLVLVRGYGLSDVEAQAPMLPTARLRIGSTSKTLTALAVLHLRDQGKLDLDARFLDVLTDLQLPATGDARIATITIRQLLNHSGGWDRTVSPDPYNEQIAVQKKLGLATPPTRNDIVRYVLAETHLDFEPGTHWAYCNVGYLILGSLIEKVSGTSYETYVRDQVLTPMGVHGMSIGYEHLAQRGPDEARTYDPWSGPSIFPGEGTVPRAYGWANLAGGDAAGGWVGSPIDLTRIATAMDGSRMERFLSADSWAEMLKNPGLPDWSHDRTWYGMGLFVGPAKDQWTHGGSLPGAQTDFRRFPNGYAWAVITNSRSEDPDGFSAALAYAMADALGDGIEGSPEDLFAQYPSPAVPARGE